VVAPGTGARGNRLRWKGERLVGSLVGKKLGLNMESTRTPVPGKAAQNAISMGRRVGCQMGVEGKKKGGRCWETYQGGQTGKKEISVRQRRIA